ncbi:MAG: filamentous hemagglutinin N-terminal domain-containing protein [Cyanobacteria bacterium P01_F01_bin.150]
MRSTLWIRSVGIAALMMVVGEITDCNRSANAQILPDATLGPEASMLEHNVLDGLEIDIIHGGAPRANLLFHSFSEFKVEEGRGAYFANPAGIESILSRVTGPHPSSILGRLGVLGEANMFLLNPNGILFGPNASLDIAGSFMATTADGFSFSDGQIFSAVDPKGPPLLTVNVRPGLQWGELGSRLTPLSPPLVRGETGSQPPSREETAGPTPTPAPSPYQGEGWAGVITNLGHLSVGESLTLVGDRLHLSGTLEAGRNLNMRSPHSIQIRDTPTEPFIATAGNHLRLRGESIDIFALNHPNSGLTAGGNLVLRSDRPVIGDAHFQAGREFRVERSSGRLGRLISETDPVIRSDGDVSFRNYKGASLHILAGGSVTVPGRITITGADTLDNALRETVMLSDGTTVVEIDGSTEPTLDIRAGIQDSEFRIQNSEFNTTGRSSANIRLGDIQNSGGLVFLSNQYRPNGELSRGNIRVGAIDTSMEQFTAGTARGGDVVIDARGNVEISGEVTTFARAGDFEVNRRGNIPRDNDFNPIIDFVGNNARAIGGNIIVFSGNNITTQNLETFAIAAAEGEETRTLQANGTEFVQSGDARASARGGAVTLATQIDTNGKPVRTSVGNIVTATIDTSARSAVDVSADASVVIEAEGDDLTNVVNKEDAGVAIAGMANTQARGGSIDLTTNVAAGDITANSEVGRLKTDSIDTDASVNAFSSASADASVDAFAFSSVSVDAENNGDGGRARGGTVSNVETQGGAIALTTNVTTGDITAESDVGYIKTDSINASADVRAIAGAGASASSIVNVFAFTLSTSAENNGDGGTASGGTVSNVETQGGRIALTTNVTTGDITAESDVGTIKTDSINADADVYAYAETYANAVADAVVYASTVAIENNGEGGTANGGTVSTVETQGGRAVLTTNVTTGAIMAESDVGTIKTNRANTGADADVSARARADADAFAFANADAGATENNGDGGTARGGTVSNVETQGGAIALTTNVTTGDITAGSDVGSIKTDRINTDANADANANAFTFANADAFTDIGASVVAVAVAIENDGDGGRASGGTVSTVEAQGGAITLMTNVSTGDIAADSDVGSITTGKIDADVDVEAEAEAEAKTEAYAENNGDGGTAHGGTVRTVDSRGGAITLRTRVDSEMIIPTATLASIQTEPIDTSATAVTDASADASADVTGGNPGKNGQASGGTASATANAGNIILSTDIRPGSTDLLSNWGTIHLNASVNTSARALADVLADGAEAQFQPENARFGANGGDISMNAMGQIQLGDNSELNASAGVFSQSFNQPETITENAQLQGGNIILSASDSILLSQISAETNSTFMINIDGVQTPVVTTTLASSAGRLVIHTPANITLRDRAAVSVSATGGEGTAGDIIFSAHSLILGERSHIFSRTDSGNGGNITINSASNPGELLLLSPRSAISTTAGTDEQGGDGGDITINSRLINTLPQYDSDITANAFNGSGGNITITTDGLFGIEFRDNETSQSDITATSRFGLDGTFSLNSPGIDPTQGAIALPTTPNDLPPINPICVAARSGSSFTLVGRGGIPPVPTDLSNEMDPWEDWYIATPEDTPVTEISSNSADYPPATEDPKEMQITEAQGWVRSSDGTTQLVAQTRTTPLSAPIFQPSDCRHIVK